MLNESDNAEDDGLSIDYNELHPRVSPATGLGRE